MKVRLLEKLLLVALLLFVLGQTMLYRYSPVAGDIIGAFLMLLAVSYMVYRAFCPSDDSLLCALRKLPRLGQYISIVLLLCVGSALVYYALPISVDPSWAVFTGWASALWPLCCGLILLLNALLWGVEVMRRPRQRAH
ncbi:MAG: hypothetical protein Q4A64_01420 [Porphyromonadaceae bacterium]|nr:hypothetical protein [Porphyromonadaceae bacterium]